MSHVVAKTLLKGLKNTVELTVLIKADFVGVEYANRERAYITAPVRDFAGESQ